MRNANRPRYDYQPCPAAMAALKEAEALTPDLSKQARIDQLILAGLWAIKTLRTSPPELKGHRAYWREWRAGTPSLKAGGDDS
jgi:hypothetical protein